MGAYATLALPVGVGKEFTYSVPPDLDAAAEVGVRAVVPFGTRYATGLIVGRPDESPVAHLKPIRDILDPEPIVSGQMLDLCRWISDYYFAPLGEVLKAAVPSGFRSPAKRLARITSAGRASASAPRPGRFGGRPEILRLLAEHDSLPVDNLSRRTGIRTIHAILNAMAREGLVCIDEVLRLPVQHSRHEKFVVLQAGSQNILESAAAAAGDGKRARRRLLLAARDLAARGALTVPARELLRASGTTSAVLMRAAGAGLLRIEQREAGPRLTEEPGETPDLVTLTTAQAEALREITEAIEETRHRIFLLHGVTGSGKTQVYIEAIRRCLAFGRGAIVLVPEISLTPQTVRRFRAHFGDQVLVVHSRMSPAERHEVWRRARRGDCRIVIGPRSAVFAPLFPLGLIVVDEEQESSYKQYDAAPRYHARDVALVRAGAASAVAVLGSATPSMESYAQARNGRYRLLTIPERIDGARLPEVRLVDMKEERRTVYQAAKAALEPQARSSLRRFQAPALSPPLRQAIALRLDRREGVILLQNRRGFALFVECVDCGFAERCDDCQVSLIFHITKNHLRCHYCGLVRPPRSTCPECGGASILLHGAGTQRVERELAEVFPAARVLRMDLDTTSRRGAHERLLRQFGDGGADILLGTQMVAKGLDFPRVTLVGVVSADTQMLLPDFRATERTFQLLTQVAGRAGRSSLRGEVIIQTHQPSHPALRHVLRHDYEGFFTEELAAREELGYPPFSRLVLLELKGEKEDRVRAEAEKIADRLRPLVVHTLVLGPSPAVIPKIRNLYRWHILLKNPRSEDPSGARLRQHLRQVLAAGDERGSRSVSVSVDADPAGLL